MATIGKPTARKLQVSIDRKALREVLTSLSKPSGENEWCVACGAGAASAKLDYPSEAVNKASAELLEQEDEKASAEKITWKEKCKIERKLIRLHT